MLDTIAFVLGVINVTLVVRRSVWNFPFGMAMVALSSVIFWRERLYSDTALQGFFFAVNAWGWWMWTLNRAATGDVRVERMPARDRLAWLLGWVVISLGWGIGMERMTDADYPWLDAAIASASIAAQVMLARRLVESWTVWIAVDVASIWLFAIKGLWPMLALFVLFLGFAVWGRLSWRAALERQRAWR